MIILSHYVLGSFVTIKRDLDYLVTLEMVNWVLDDGDGCSCQVWGDGLVGHSPSTGDRV